MRFRDPETGKVFENEDNAIQAFCNNHVQRCARCPIHPDNTGAGVPCGAFLYNHPDEAARRMGYEIIKDKKEGPTGGDLVNHPAHYTQGGIECIDALKAATEGLEGIEAVCTANAIKYLWRWKHKGGVQDLEKAEWYIRRLKAEVAE